MNNSLPIVWKCYIVHFFVFICAVKSLQRTYLDTQSKILISLHFYTLCIITIISCTFVVFDFKRIQYNEKIKICKIYHNILYITKYT